MSKHLQSKLSDNDLRQALRIAGGSALGFTVCKLLDWPMGIFFTVYPMLLLGLVPMLNGHIIRQFVASGLFGAVGILLLWGIFSSYPVLITLLVFVIYAWLFLLMSKGAYFLFGALSLVGFSIQLHFASYAAGSNVIYPLVVSNLLAIAVSIFSALLMHQLFPDVAPRTPPVRPQKDSASIRHEVLLCASVATLSFVVFQVIDLQDSISAQAASILILFPLCWKGAGVAGWMRAIGTLVGCNLALACQLLLYSHSDILPFTVFSLWIMLFIFGRYHVISGGAPGIAFGVITTFGILFGQSLGPNQDLFYSALYRFSSVSVTILLTLGVVYLMDRGLNRFVPTRHYTYLS